MPDLIAGQIDLMFAEGTSALPHVRSGRIKAFGVMAKARWFAAPDVPTMDELEAPGLYVSFWHGLWVVKGTPSSIIARLNAAIVEALADPRGAAAAHRHRPGNSSARPTDSRRPRRAAEGRSREMVADHQGGGHQGAMSSNTAMLSRSRANQCPVSGVKQLCRRNLETAEFDPKPT
jgi:Tripartite tricarboxylate transporter family receptor